MAKGKWRTVAALALIVTLSATQIASARYADVGSWGECEDIGNGLEKCSINSPPPAIIEGLDLHRPLAEPPVPGDMGVTVQTTVPAYNWYMGCSATSGSMIAAYYDRNGYGNMYTGPTNGGVMPMDNSSWATFTDIAMDTYRVTPLTGSRNGWDGRTTRGSSDDYWIEYESTAPDPFITNGWTEHAWGDAIGDYMKTSQSAYSNTDGMTHFINWLDQPGPYTCADMVDAGLEMYDGTYGRKLFYEARGYTVTDCYNRKTDNVISGGFSFADYMAEINGGRPVMINLEDHTIVGIGYNTTGNIVILNDTWDYSNHIMTWGSSYAGSAMDSVSIVNLASGPPPGPFNKITPADGSYTVTDPTISWSTSSNAGNYKYCIDTIDNDICDDEWLSAGSTNSLPLSGLIPNTTYYWAMAAWNSNGAVFADGGTWWSFTALPVSFADVPSSHWAWSWIERLYWAGITSGCGGGNYCPNSSVTRAEMAIFLERGIHGSSYTPPAATGTVFGDVPISHWAAAWIEQLSADGITGGCGGGNFCPTSAVTRAEMAIFLLRSKHGSSYTPPAATGTVFADVPISHWAADWIEQLAAEGITSGCGGGNYCPNGAATRAEMAIFLVRTFALP
jgi:hypothetical protein